MTLSAPIRPVDMPRAPSVTAMPLATDQRISGTVKSMTPTTDLNELGTGHALMDARSALYQARDHVGRLGRAPQTYSNIRWIHDLMPWSRNLVCARRDNLQASGCP